MKIREIENYGFKILNERAKDGSMTVYSKFSETEKFNKNKRFYPYKLMKREVDRVQAKIASGQFMGSADHGNTPATFLKNVSHLVTKLEMIGNDGFATVKILNTDSGRNVQQIVKGGGRIGLSTKSTGTIDANGYVNSDLRLLSLDLVTDPSVKDATFSKENILEGVEFSEEENEVEKGLEEAINALEKESYLGALESGFKGSEAEFHKMYGGGLREMVGLSEAEGSKTTVEKLTEEQVSARTYSFYQESVSGGFPGSFDEWKEKFPQLVEQAKEKVVLSEKKEEVKVPFKSSATWEEIVQSGYHGTMAEFEERYPNIKIIRPESPQKKVVVEQTLEQEAAKIFVALSKDNPNSQLTLEDVVALLEKQEEKKTDKRIRRKAIAIVSRELDGSLSQDQIEKMVEAEVENLKKQREEMRERNWLAYKKLLD